MKRVLLPAILCFTLVLGTYGSVLAGSTIEWDASTGTVNGYKIYWGTAQGGPYSGSYDVAGATSCPLAQLPLLENTTYYLVVRAYNDAGESENSNEVSYFVPDSTPPAAPQGVSVQ